jgi:hypothetical protein
MKTKTMITISFFLDIDECSLVSQFDAVTQLCNRTVLNFCKAFWENGCINLGMRYQLETA